MSEEPLRLSVDGALAARIRRAARAAGISPAAWVAQLVAHELRPQPQQPEAQQPEAQQPEAQQSPVDPVAALADAGAWESRTDDQGLFGVLVPRGWSTRVWSQPGPASRASLVTTTSPDGAVTLASGDAQLPMYADPRFPMFTRPPGVVPRPPTSAEQFAREWLQHRHGGRPGLQLTGWQDSPELAQIMARVVQRQGGQLAWNSAGLLFFSAADVRGVVAASTTSIGAFWIPQVHLATGPGDPAALVSALLTLVGSLGLTPVEQQRANQARASQDAQHQATMAGIDAQTRIMTAGHQQRMHDIAVSGAAHQQRMADLQGIWQAQTDSWRASQASSDASHDATMSGLRTGAADPTAGGSGHLDYLNMIREEKTLLDPDGYEHQVSDVDADRYFYNEHERRWIGLQQHEDLHDVARAQGLNPDDWREGRIKS